MSTASSRASTWSVPFDTTTPPAAHCLVLLQSRLNNQNHGQLHVLVRMFLFMQSLITAQLTRHLAPFQPFVVVRFLEHCLRHLT